MKTFKEKVYAETARIPKGKVATYGEIAALAGSAVAARAVGQLMARNNDTDRVPCHRVVGATGALVGYAFDGIAFKRKKLIDEGVVFEGARVDLKRSRWDS